ncbi:SWI/SNF-related matrix-associated actin-dependent regulator of chromatin subfamily A-like protein 1 [Sycon ciliatum]|uniref:SWI/SNF-related matrix-associated actin-dependent regulator of chromatin subfamily A-like protein 1 n=1 Tax=Sycon ciliatum TaxID=27933 RepID=UPI0031F620FC
MYKALFKTNYTGVIVDEAHKIKNPRSKRTQALVGWQGKAKRLLTKDNIKQCILLSGTPMMQRPWELYSVLRGLIPDELGPYSKSSMYAIHFCKGYKDVYGRWITNGSDNLEELSEITKKLIFPVSRERIERNLPPIRKQIVRLSCGGTYLAQEKAYNIESLEDITSSIGFEGLSELRHLMAIQKIPYIQDYVKNLLLSGEKVIVFAWHRAVLQSILTYVQALSLPRDVLLLDGSVPPSQRQSLCHKFNTENYSIALCQISAVSEGLSLHTATHVVFSEISWNPSDNEQALKRSAQVH